MKSELGRFLPQTEAEWLQTGEFEIGNSLILGNSIRYALVRPQAPSRTLTVMVGGIPRDAERQRTLPLINKLYGRLALLQARRDSYSLLYSQPGTGKSTGDLSRETFRTRIDTLVGLISDIAR